LLKVADLRRAEGEPTLAPAPARRYGSPMSKPIPPVAPKHPKRIEQLGHVRIDDYAWLKDDNWQAVLRDPSVVRADVRAHLEAENAYTAAMLAPTEALQASMFSEMKGRIKEDDSSVPASDGAWDYLARYAIGAQHPIHARRPRGASEGEQILLDEEAESQGKAFYQVGGAAHSPDHALYAWAVDEQGSEVYRILVKDLATGEVLPGPVESSTGGFVISPDSRWLFWIWRDDHGRPAKVVFDEPDEGFFISVGLTSSRDYIVIGSGDHETSEARLIPAEDPTAEPRVVEPRTPGLRYDVEHWDGQFMIHTNADGAVDFKVMTAPLADPSRANWTDWAPHRPGRYVVGIDAYRDWFVQLVRENANNSLILTERGTGAEHAVAFDEDAYALSLSGGYEFDTTTLRFVYESPTTPRRWFDYDMATRERVLRKTQDIPSGHDPAAYVTRRLHATAADGAEVPITVLMRADTPVDGSAPLLLYGYGSYGISMEPHFSIRNLSLVDRGWIWATAHVRGGSEKGWGWFLDGRGARKPNTFSDFIACAEHLIAGGYGQAGRIVAYGGSAGGMLMGAIANLHPDLWAGIIGAVPFVDVLNTMSDTTLPLTPPEWPEWGNPLEDEAAYQTIAAYSPYDNIVAQPYPAVLATGGLSDPRVTYWEPAKWVAKLREFTTGEAPILLKINMEAGHGGASGRFDFLKEIALDYAFAVWAVDRGWAGEGSTG
jgi:oligopeptidase B